MSETKRLKPVDEFHTDLYSVDDTLVLLVCYTNFRKLLSQLLAGCFAYIICCNGANMRRHKRDQQFMESFQRD